MEDFNLELRDNELEGLEAKRKKLLEKIDMLFEYHSKYSESDTIKDKMKKVRINIENYIKNDTNFYYYLREQVKIDESEIEHIIKTMSTEHGDASSEFLLEDLIDKLNVLIKRNKDLKGLCMEYAILFLGAYQFDENLNYLYDPRKSLLDENGKIDFSNYPIYKGFYLEVDGERKEVYLNGKEAKVEDLLKYKNDIQESDEDEYNQYRGSR